MERMGLEDDVAIESRLVSKTIESAQSRVEGFNFDIRKRVVEFDDVINKQRETIYAERDKVLRNEDLGETILDLLDQEVDALLDQFVGGDTDEGWNLEGLSAALRAMGLDGPGTSEDELWEIGGREAIAAHLRELVDHKLEEKEREVGEVDWTMIERLVLLRTIDSLWVEHLTELDDMRRGIGLRGYAQQDPLNEFRREAFSLYTELRDLIRHQLASTIFRVTVSRQPPAGGDDGRSAARSSDGGQPSDDGTNGEGPNRDARPQPVAAGPVARGLASGPNVRGVRESLGDEVVAGGGGPGGPAAGLRPGFTPSGDRIGRNDICFCGSGLKYKRCHGR